MALDRTGCRPIAPSHARQQTSKTNDHQETRVVVKWPNEMSRTDWKNHIPEITQKSCFLIIKITGEFSDCF
jgi:hypothetical protein